MIYCVEDDISIRELMLYTLRASGYDAMGFEQADAFWKAIEENEPELILLDVMLPDGDGTEILRKLKAHPKTENIPVIMASAKGTEYDKVQGLDLGADDYLAKPFGMMEMISRIRAVMRRCGHSADTECLTYGEIVLDTKQHSVLVQNVPVELTRKEYELLKLFLSSPGQAFTREQLLSLVWDSEFMGESRTVDVHIASLRTKLGEPGGYIKTLRGVGYRLEGNK